MDIVSWEKRCGFEHHTEAIKALGCQWRSYYRWKAEGLPKGLAGKLILQRMKEIESRRTRSVNMVDKKN